MATYFLTPISLANLFSPGSRNEVEAAGLSETATTIPLRKPRDDIPRPEKSTFVWREERRREEGEEERSRLALSSPRLFREDSKVGDWPEEKSRSKTKEKDGNALASCSAKMFFFEPA